MTDLIDSRTKHIVDEMINKNDNSIESFHLELPDQPNLFRKKNNTLDIILDQPKNISLMEYNQQFYENEIMAHSTQEYFPPNCMNSFRKTPNNIYFQQSNVLYNGNQQFPQLKEIEEESTFIEKSNSHSQLSNFQTKLSSNQDHGKIFITNRSRSGFTR